MTEFNIENSKIEQMSESGNNYKFTGNSGNVVVTESGDVAQTIGENNEVRTNKNQEKGLIKSLFAAWQSICAWFTRKK